MTTTLEIDPNWQLKLPDDPNFKLSRPFSCFLRSDLSHPPQIYFSSKVKTGEDKVKVEIFQAVAQTDTSASVVTFFRQNITNTISEHMVCHMIDEVKGKLYIWTSSNSMATRTIVGSFLFMYNIDFGQPDPMGFRRITVHKESARLLLNKKWDNPNCIPFPFICPNGDLYVTVNEVEGINSGKRLMGKVRYDESNAVCNLVIVDRQAWITSSALYHSHVLTVSRNNKVIIEDVFISKNDPNKVSHTTYSYIVLDPKPKLADSRSVVMDPHVPLSQVADTSGINLRLWERNYKYQIFIKNKTAESKKVVDKYILCGQTESSCLIGVKNFEKHFTFSGKSPIENIVLPARNMFDFFTPADEAQQIVQGSQVMLSQWMARDVVYVRACSKVMRFNLGTRLKDYRICACCNKEEERKRRNRNNKRIADFRVCRECKRRNFHIRWREFPCFYCSLECMKKHWPSHNELHKKKALKRD